MTHRRPGYRPEANEPKPHLIYQSLGSSNAVGTFSVTGYDPELNKPNFRKLTAAIPTIEAQGQARDRQDHLDRPKTRDTVSSQ